MHARYHTVFGASVRPCQRTHGDDHRGKKIAMVFSRSHDVHDAIDGKNKSMCPQRRRWSYLKIRIDLSQERKR